MLLPEIKSPETPDAPPWAEAEFANQHEYEGMKRSLAAVVGYDDRKGQYVLMGTGVLVGFIPGNGVIFGAGLYVATATHVVMGFVNLYLDRLQYNNFYAGDNEALFKLDMKRVETVVNAGKLKVVVESAQFGPPYIFDVRAAIVGDEKDSDCTMLVCTVPQALEKSTFLPAIMDYEHANEGERFVMAGFARPKGFPEHELVTLPFDQVHNIGRLRGGLVARVSRVVEVSNSRPMMRAGSLHWRVSMPSEPGMSGGALLRLREPKGSAPGQPQINTTIGLISSGWSTADDSDTWTCPVVVLQAIMGIRSLLLFDYSDIEARLKKVKGGNFGVLKFDYAELLKEKVEKIRKVELAQKEPPKP
jgi:hypothetical protein